jgi:hypothetical protein
VAHGGLDQGEEGCERASLRSVCGSDYRKDVCWVGSNANGLNKLLEARPGGYFGCDGSPPMLAVALSSDCSSWYSSRWLGSWVHGFMERGDDCVDQGSRDDKGKKAVAGAAGPNSRQHKLSWN